MVCKSSRAAITAFSMICLRDIGVAYVEKILLTPQTNLWFCGPVLTL
jgi:hypothetical protein